ncbi:MAG: VOC family protein [Burkholderiales bacterium]
MIGYTTVGTNDLSKASAFFDEVLAPMGARRVTDFLGRGCGWGNGKGKPLFGVIQPHDRQPASVGNGTMVALAVADAAQVEALHAKAVALGAKDEGAPGKRTDHFYGAYFRDLDGNKICVFCVT